MEWQIPSDRSSSAGGAKSPDFHINPAPHTQVPPGVYDPMGYPIREWSQRTPCVHRIQGRHWTRGIP